MARARSPEKRSAILEAAVYEIAAAGLGAPTAKIAGRAGVAEGTLFTYFASKDVLLNELYVELKSEVYARVNEGFPEKASLERRAWHVWSTYLGWAVQFPEKRKVSVQLNLCDLVSAETRAQVAGQRGAIDATVAELGKRAALRELPAGFAAATMSAMQEATMDFIAKHPRRRKELIQKAFLVFWRLFR
jgi:AcrR family transcriptional regulator